MDKKKQNLAWASLSKEMRLDIVQLYVEFQDESKGDYINRPFWVSIIRKFETIFGHHNLTSDTEPSECICVERKKLDSLHDEIHGEIMCAHDDDDWQSAAHYILDVMPRSFHALFGDKCLPDKQPSVQVEPKFKVGDFALVTDGYAKGSVITIKAINVETPISYKSDLKDDGMAQWFPESQLEPYTEPEIKDNMEEKELNLVELLKGCEGERFYSPITGFEMVLKEAIGDYLLFKGTDFQCNADGRMYANGHIVLWPSRALYEKYPLDAKKAWEVWASDRKPTRWTPQIGERIFWVNANLTVSQDRFNDFETQRKRRAVGNAFKTGKEAEQAAEAVRECLRKFHEKNCKQ